MLRVVALFVILLAGLSLLVSTEAYQIARPVNPAQVTVVSTDMGALKVAIGPNNPYNMVTMVNGRLQLDMGKGPGGSTIYGFANSSRYTLKQIIRVTNTTGAPKNISVTATGATRATLSSVTGYVNGAGSALSQPIAVLAGQYVDINLEWTAVGPAGTNTGMTLTVTGN